MVAVPEALSLAPISAKVAEVVVVRREHEATIVTSAFNFCYHVEKLIVLQPFIVDIKFYVFHTLDGFRCHPDDGLIHDTMTVSLEELDGRLPSVDETCVRTLARLLQTRESVAMPVGEPELASH